MGALLSCILSGRLERAECDVAGKAVIEAEPTLHDRKLVACAGNFGSTALSTRGSWGPRYPSRLPY